jgi:HprK-related kinase B
MTANKYDRKEIIRAVRSAHPAGHTIHLAFENVRIEVQVSDKAIVDELAHYYEPFVVGRDQSDIRITVHEAPVPALPFSFKIKKPDPGKTKIKEEYVDLPDGRIVRKRLTGMVFIFGEDDHLAVGPCLENCNQVINFINNRYIQWKLRRGCLLGHAAGVLRNKRGLALCGRSGRGKSTLALHLLSRGADFVSNDRLLIEKNSRGLMMHGVAKLPRINPGTILNNPDIRLIIPPAERERLASLSRDELWHLEQKYDVDIARYFGGDRFRLSGPMNGLVILNWERADEPMKVGAVNLEGRPDLLPSFIKSEGLFFLPGMPGGRRGRSEKDYLHFLSSCKVYEISGGVDFTAATEACLAILDRDRLPVV